MTYREFLDRSWALPLVVFNIGSLAFTGLVLLGVGHQVHLVSGSPAHGWSVTLASVVSLVSLGSTLILLGRAISAIDPATGRRVRQHYALKAVGATLRGELRDLACLSLMLDRLRLIGRGGVGTGIDVTAGGSTARRVRDVSPGALELLKWHAKRKGYSEPVVRVWPGRTVTPSSALLTVDPRSGPVARWWARHSVWLRRVSDDPLNIALETMHADVMDHIRAGRPVDANESMEALADLLDAVWQGYAAYGQAYDQDAASLFWIGQPTVAARIMRMLDAELRAAAVSRDEQVRRSATTVPLRIARSALRNKAASSIRDALVPLLSAYDAVIGELTDGGRQLLPPTGLARRRTGAPFQAVLSFTIGDLQVEIDRAVTWTARASLSTDAAELDAAQFAAAQLATAHRQLLFMLQRAIQVRDITTLREVLPKWRMPDTSRVRDAIETSTASRHADGPTGEGSEPAGRPAWQDELVMSLDLARNELEAMIFRLFVDAAQIDRVQSAAGSPGASATGPFAVQPDPDPRTAMADPAVLVILGLLPVTRPWQVLDAALHAAQNDWARPRCDEEIFPTGVAVTSLTNLLPAMLDAFVLAAIMRPDLAAGEPEPAVAMTHAQAIRDAVDRVVAKEKPWLQGYGVSAEAASQRGAALRDQLTKTEQAARRREQDEILASPISSAAKERLHAVVEEEFRASDIASRILRWAGSFSGRDGGQDGPGTLASVAVIAPRAILLDENHGNISDLGTEIGRRLAAELMATLLVTAGREGIVQVMSHEECCSLVRTTIKDLRPDGDPGHIGSPSAARLVAFIPAPPPSGIKNVLEISETPAENRLRGKPSGRLASSRERMLMELALPVRRSWQLYGLIDDVPVIQISGLQGRIVLVDLARFARVVMPSGSSNSRETLIYLTEPDEAEVRSRLRRDAADHAASPQIGAPAEDVGTQGGDRVREEMLKITIDLRVPGRIRVSDRTAARVLRWEQ